MKVLSRDVKNLQAGNLRSQVVAKPDSTLPFEANIADDQVGTGQVASGLEGAAGI